MMNRGGSSLNPYAASYVPLFKRDVSEKPEAFKVTTKDSKSVKNEPVLHKSAEHTTQNKQLDRRVVDDEFDMDMEFLQMTFPGISYQSLVDVYELNKGDFEAAIDMLNLLEFDSGDSSGSLPDSLDIGDVTESESSSLKLKELVGEAASSSSRTRKL